MPEGPAKSSIVDVKEQIPIYPLDVYVLTDKGEAELKGGSTSLLPTELELLVLIDGRANVGQLRQRFRSVPEDELKEMLRRLIGDGLVKAATIADEESLDFSNFFDADKTAPEPSPEAKQKAEKEAEVGTPELQRCGYYVSIARRAAELRKVESGSTPSILIVEDDRHLSNLLKLLLDMEGFQTRVAMNREEIVAALRQLPSPSLVLLDVILPDANGFDILQRIKQHPNLKSIPVVMLTGQAKRESVMQGLAGGADGYVTKPFEVDILIKGVKSVLGLS